MNSTESKAIGLEAVSRMQPPRVGDIIIECLGIVFYQVIKRTPKTIVVRRLQKRRWWPTEASPVVPIKDKFAVGFKDVTLRLPMDGTIGAPSRHRRRPWFCSHLWKVWGGEPVQG